MRTPRRLQIEIAKFYQRIANAEERKKQEEARKKTLGEKMKDWILK